MVAVSWFNWYSVALSYLSYLIVGGILLGVGLLFLGYILNNEKYKKAAWSELWELVLVVLLFSLFLPSLANISSAAVRSIDPIGAKYYCTASFVTPPSSGGSGGSSGGQSFGPGVSIQSIFRQYLNGIIYGGQSGNQPSGQSGGQSGGHSGSQYGGQPGQQPPTTPPQASPSSSTIDPCFILVGDGYLRALLVESIAAYRNVLSFYIFSKMGETTASSFGQQGVEFSQRVGGYLAPLNVIIEYYMGFFQKVMILIAFQYFLYDFVAKTFVIMVFVGSILRAFPLTRKMGGTILGVYLSLFFFYPAVLSIMDSIYFSIEPSPHTHMRLNRIYTGASGLMLEVKDYQTWLSGSPKKIKGAINNWNFAYAYTRLTPDGRIPTSPIQSTLPQEQQNDVEQAEQQYNEFLQLEGPAITAAEQILDKNVPLTQRVSKVKKVISWLLNLFTKSTLLIAPYVPGVLASGGLAAVRGVGSLFGRIFGGRISGFVVSAGRAIAASPVGDLLIGAGIAGMAAIGVSSFLSYTQFLFYLVIALGDMVANFVFFGGFLSYIAIVATIGAMKGTSRFLGGDFEIAGLTQFI